jgi:hypothetical protein
MILQLSLYSLALKQNEMKKNTSYIVFAIAVGFYLLTAISIPSKKEFVSNDKDKLLIELISHVIQRGHFNVKSLNDDMSEQIFHTYLESIDGQKRYFLQSDYREFTKYMYRIDDQLRELDFTFFDLTYQRLTLLTLKKRNRLIWVTMSNYSLFLKPPELKSGESNSSYRH